VEVAPNIEWLRAKRRERFPLTWCWSKRAGNQHPVSSPEHPDKQLHLLPRTARYIPWTATSDVDNASLPTTRCVRVIIPFDEKIWRWGIPEKTGNITENGFQHV